MCYENDFNNDNFQKNITIKKCPDIDGTYEVRIYEDGDYKETESEFSTIPKNWGEYTNQSISNWKIVYEDGWCGFRGVYAWKLLNSE